MLTYSMSGGLSYEPAIVIANSKDRIQLLLLLAPFSALGGFIQMIPAIWAGFKDKSHGVPLLCVLWFFAHDSTFLLNHHYWFYESGSWMAKGTWYQMIFYTMTEAVVMVQILRYSRAEVFPRMGLGTATLSLIALQIFAFAVFWWFWSVTKDSLFLLNFATTVILSPIPIIPMLRARGSRKGFNVLSIWGIPLLSIGYWPWMFVLEPTYFLQPVIVIVAVGNLSMSLACVWYWSILPPYRSNATT